MHAGNAFNFLLAHRAARQGGARLLLRIDDLDAARMRPEYLADIFESLAWLRINWDEGPQSADDFLQNWSQRRRLSHYEEALRVLREAGALFPCKRSRRQLALWNGEYPPERRRDYADAWDDPDAAWRMDTPPGFPLPAFVVKRRDGLPAYQLASLTDDRLFGVTHVIRGEDLAPSTAAQRLLARALGWSFFEKIRFLHHPLITDPSGQKLSKSAGAYSLRQMRREGGAPDSLHPRF